MATAPRNQYMSQLVLLVSRHRRQREIYTTTFFIWLKRKQTQYHGLMNFRSKNGVDFELQRRVTCAVASSATKSEIGFRRATIVDNFVLIKS